MQYDVCFINPPRPYLVDEDAQAPLGILYLAAVCETAGLRVKVLNLSGIDPETFLYGGGYCTLWEEPFSDDEEDGMGVDAHLLPKCPVFAITGTSLDVPVVNALAYQIKQESDRRVLVGGPITLSIADLRLDCIDTVFVGEAENEIVDIVKYGGRPVEFGTVADVGMLPYPSRHLWPDALGKAVFIDHEERFPNGSTTIMSSRGCPYKCAFCAGPKLRSRPHVRFRDPEDFVDEMERVVKDYDVRQFRLCDEFFTVKREHVAEICGYIQGNDTLENGLGCAWRASVGVKPHDLDLFQEMASAGCVELSLGVETADPDVLSLISRKGSVPDAHAALSVARRAGLRTRALLMTGLPGTTEKTFEADINFIKTAEYDALALTVFTPLPGSEIFDHPERFGCTLRTDINRESVCLYGPNGRTRIEPTIDIEGLTRAEFAAGMERVANAAEASGHLGKG